MKRTCRFTLIEMLVVMSIIIVLAGLLLVGIGRARHKARTVQVESDFRLIETAISAYQTTYNSLYPWHYSINPTPATSVDYLFLDNPAVGKPSIGDLLESLQGADPALNPRRIPFLEGGVAQTDPWGKSYRVAVDTAYDDDIDADLVYGHSGSPIRKSIVIWSRGPDGADSPTTNNPSNADNINSWKR